MIALTQEKREELKAFLSDSIENRCTVYTLAKQRELEALRDQIALASLTARDFGYGISEPDGSIYLSECCIDEYGSTVTDEVTALNNGVTDLEGGYKVVQLFTAPPVPEIKLPSAELIKEVFIANGFKEKTQADGSVDLNPYVYDAARALIKRLNGLGE